MVDNIYTYLKNNFNKKDISYCFNKDYILNPLKRGETPNRNDLEYFYIDLNLTRDDLCKLFNKGIRVIKRYISICNIKKPMKTAIINSVYTYKKRCSEDMSYKSNRIEKIKQSKLIKYGDQNYNNRQKTEQTNIQRYGVKRPLQNKQIHDKLESSNIKKYGVKTPLMIAKNRLTKKISKEELKCLLLLKKKFKNVISQYKSELYPFNCDFYIPELDLYIEYQGFGGGHNNRPFDETCEKDLLELKYHQQMAENGNTMSQRIIRAWFISDPIKRKVAKNNKLNYLEFFNIQEFMKWYNN